MEDQETQLISLNDSLQPLQDYFNSNQGKERFLALVSPTCAECLFGAEAVHHSILEPFPSIEISASIIWVPMLKTDNEEMARLAAATISDPRVTHFYDGSNRAGKAIASLFGEANKLAWDIYLFFSETGTWQELPPKPEEWFHQLDDGWANPGHYRCGKALQEALHQTIQKRYSLKSNG